MDHPLRSDIHLPLRRDIYHLFQYGFNIPRQSNIIFVCGGNDPHNMRRLFQSRFNEILPGFEFFEPEFAMNSYWDFGISNPFDIATFEILVGDISHSIVIFPEAPGSFAETGYFSAIDVLLSKILLVLDSKHAQKDSFISIGPAKRIADRSVFQPNIQLDYDNPDFGLISRRILDRSPRHPTKRALEIKEFSKTNNFELFAIIQYLVSTIGAATIDDIEYFMRGLFSGHISSSRIKQIVSILVGSERLTPVGDFGHLRVQAGRPLILQVRDGAKTRRDVLNVEISGVNITADPQFRAVLET